MPLLRSTRGACLEVEEPFATAAALAHHTAAEHAETAAGCELAEVRWWVPVPCVVAPPVGVLEDGVAWAHTTRASEGRFLGFNAGRWRVRDTDE